MVRVEHTLEEELVGVSHVEMYVRREVFQIYPVWYPGQLDRLAINGAGKRGQQVSL